METKNTFGGAQKNAGRKPKEGVRTSFILSPRGRAILEAAAVTNGSSSMAPTLEIILRDYALRHKIEVSIDDEPPKKKK